MSQTIVDFPKVTQMLDAGWNVHLSKNALRTYTAEAFRNHNGRDESVETDDFTPEQALTRLAYKCVDGLILDSQPGATP